jgi:excisionase family DNA binding protein
MNLLTADQVAERLGLTVHQVYRRLRRGDLPYTADGPQPGKYYVTPEDLQVYIDKGQPLSRPRRDPSMMSVPQVAELLSFTDETVRRLCYEGKLSYVKGTGSNGHLRIPRRSVQQYLATTAEARPDQLGDDEIATPGIAMISRDFF